MASKSDNNKGYNDSVFDWGSRQSFGDFLKSTSIGSGNSEVSGKVFLQCVSPPTEGRGWGVGRRLLGTTTRRRPDDDPISPM